MTAVRKRHFVDPGQAQKVVTQTLISDIDNSDKILRRIRDLTSEFNFSVVSNNNRNLSSPTAIPNNGIGISRTLCFLYECTASFIQEYDFFLKYSLKNSTWIYKYCILISMFLSGTNLQIEGSFITIDFLLNNHIRHIQILLKLSCLFIIKLLISSLNALTKLLNE